MLTSTRFSRCWLAVVVLIAAHGARAQTNPPSPAPSGTGAPANPANTVADKLTGHAAWEALVGNTITGKTAGSTFSEFFDPGGAVKYVDQNGLSAGTWTVENDRVCFDFPEDDDRSCSAFEVEGHQGTSVDDDGATAHFEIQPGNSKGL